MQFKIIVGGIFVGLLANSFADCNFTYVNKTHSSVTLQGYFLDDGDGQSKDAWVTVEPTRQITQVRGGKKCNALLHHTGQVVTRVDLKNASGYWIGNKGFLFAADRSYSHTSADKALADDGDKITLSNASKITGAEFKVVICAPEMDSDNCK